MFPALNFPSTQFRIRKNTKGTPEIFDQVRKRFVALTPEEWVRQHLLEFMCQEKKFPRSLLAVEKQLQLNSTRKRADVLAYAADLRPIFLAECKAPDVILNIAALQQVMRYNLVFRVPFMLVTNGISHFVFARSADGNSWNQQDDFPDYTEMLKAL